MKATIKIMLILLISMSMTSGIHNNIIENISVNNDTLLEANEENIEEPEIVFDGLTLEELSNKLERNLNSSISGYGEVFAKKSIDLGLDPYLAVAIMLHETGCKWNCSNLMKQCNNVGGMKGTPGCNGGPYKSFDSLDEGIDAYLNNLYYKFYSKGYTTPEQIGPRYAASTTWAEKVNRYINEIKNS